MRRRIPSIEALVAFEAAARHLNFTRAADALSLTQSAVCKQIASLEDYLGVPLFNRIKKRISLTEAGAVYAKRVSEDLDRLERNTISLMSHRGERNVLELAVIPTFGSRWLIPRLAQFHAANPGITVNLTTRSDPFVFTETPFDAAIHFGSSVWPGAISHPLFGEEMVPVCSPQLLRQHPCREPRELARLPLLHQTNRHAAWQRWFEVAGIKDVDVMGGPRFDLFSMLVEAACAGLGVALVPRFLALSELASGELVAPFDIALRSEMGYHLVYPDPPSTNPALQRFTGWLLAEAAAYRDSQDLGDAARAA
ncbi:transcriptional regulator GcvA [Aromatoleum diolicum]|uniref:Transcriptional regulator GcvA n=1 Tax=Aromatoleum diolicum TaxID=75796 RepID=A0ABX1Q8S6_9RHOO|nr:transcriptional regulator GcvA [Aromatoleum diolicum]NMG74460.1 transcriptional regulator GcvA [Aromatoleum diolicum]